MYAPFGILLCFFVLALGGPAGYSFFSVLSSIVGYGAFLSCMKGYKRSFRKNLFVFIFFTAVASCHLVFLATPKYHGIGIYFLWIILSSWIGTGWFLVYKICQGKKHSSAFLALYAASIFTLFDYARLKVLCGFAFNQLGYTLANTVIGAQLSSVIGVLGLGFLIVCTNLLFYQRKYLLFALLAVTPFLYGGARLHLFSKESFDLSQLKTSEKVLRVALVQTNVTPEQKIPMQGLKEYFIHPLRQWQNILNILENSSIDNSVELIVFPESTFPYGLKPLIYEKNQSEFVFSKSLKKRVYFDKALLSNHDLLQMLAWEKNANIVIGLDDYDLIGIDERAEKKHFNAAFFLEQSTERISRYDKKALLPLVEYLPASFLRPFAEIYGITEFFSRGDKSPVFLGKVPFGLSVCYDECFSSIMRESRRSGAELFINLTNDAYYPKSNLPILQFYHGRVRAIENGVPMIRCCNTGVTCIIDCYGRVLHTFIGDRGETESIQGVLVGDVPLTKRDTIYASFGDAPILWVSLFFVLVLVFNRKQVLKKN